MGALEGLYYLVRGAITPPRSIIPLALRAGQGPSLPLPSLQEPLGAVDAVPEPVYELNTVFDDNRPIFSKILIRYTNTFTEKKFSI